VPRPHAAVKIAIVPRRRLAAVVANRQRLDAVDGKRCKPLPRMLSLRRPFA